MLDIFDQPWTLIGVSVLVLFGVLTFRSIFPEKKSQWQWLLPLFTIATAFGADYLVQTDYEKIDTVINTGMKAVEKLDYPAIEAILDENYADSVHNSKTSLMVECRNKLSQNKVEKCKKTNQLIKMSGNNSRTTVFAKIFFAKDSYIAQNLVPFIPITVELYLNKKNDNKWLINRVEVREINQGNASWSTIR